jgi:hypothetical protein
MSLKVALATVNLTRATFRYHREAWEPGRIGCDRLQIS